MTASVKRAGTWARVNQSDAIHRHVYFGGIQGCIYVCVSDRRSRHLAVTDISESSRPFHNQLICHVLTAANDLSECSLYSCGDFAAAFVVSYWRWADEGLSLTTSRAFYSVSQKSSPPLKLFAIFSPVVNLCNWKFSWLLPYHILTRMPVVFVYLNMCINCITFISKTPQIITVRFSLLRNSRNFFS